MSYYGDEEKDVGEEKNCNISQNPPIPPPQAAPPPKHTMSKNPPTTDMFFSDEENPTMWFTEFQRMLPLTWTDAEKTSHFANHIVPSSYTSDWFNALTPAETATLAKI